MQNREIAKVLEEVAEILELQQVSFKPQAYRKAARSISELKQPVKDLKDNGNLDDIPGVGKSIQKKIEELLDTGKLDYLDRIKKEIPAHIVELMKIPGLGPKKINILNRKLGITSLKSLEKAARQGSIAQLEGFGKKSQEDILNGIAFIKKHSGRMMLGQAYPIAEDILSEITSHKSCAKAVLAGSLRRMKEAVHDIDILAVSTDARSLMEYFTRLRQAERIISHGSSKSSIMTHDPVQVDLRIVHDSQFGAAMQYFTGSKEHNVKLRQLSIRKGYKLSEYGLFEKDTGEPIAGENEEDIYTKLGLQYIPPELREDTAEIDAAQEGSLPSLITQGDIRGDLHIHSIHSDGTDDYVSLAKAAKDQGYSYIAVTDHSGSQRIANGLDEKRIRKAIDDIEEANNNISGITILKGAEVDILPDGKLDYDKSILSQLDVVIASVHSAFSMPKEKMTERVLAAMDSQNMNILAHPTGRLIGRREPYEIDLDKIFEKASEIGIALEINSFPDRLDLKDIHVRSAISHGAKVCINTDSHSTSHLGNMRFGIGTARRGWAQKKDVINTQELPGLMRFFKKR